jgi:hypothetical protein
MPKKIPITVLFTVVTAVVALLAATEVGAQCPASFDQTTYKWFECRGFRVAIVDPFPSYDSINDTSTFTWEVSNLSANYGPSHVEVLIERIFSGMIEGKVNGSIVNGGLVCDGSGDSSSDFGKYLTYNCLYKWTPLPSPLPNPLQVSLTIQGQLASAPSDFFIKAGSCPVGPSGRDCPNSAWGPIQAPAPLCISVLGPYTPSATSDVRTIKGVQIKILRDPETGCGYALQYSTDGGQNWTTVNPGNPPTIGGTAVVDCGGTTAKSGCSQECIVTAAASPGWTYVNLGGKWYKVWIP